MRSLLTIWNINVLLTEANKEMREVLISLAAIDAPPVGDLPHFAGNVLIELISIIIMVIMCLFKVPPGPQVQVLVV